MSEVNKKYPLWVRRNGKLITFYEFLEVKENATEEELKKAYRKKAVEFHPDKHQGDTEKEKIFKALQTVWEILRKDRKTYDAVLYRHRNPQVLSPTVTFHFGSGTSTGTYWAKFWTSS